MEETLNLSNQEIISQLTKSKHGDLLNYVPITTQVAKHDIEFLAHLQTWNLIKGEIRDSKIALPIITLRHLGKNDSELAENSVCNLLSLDPTNLVKAYNFNKLLSKSGSNISGGHRKMLEAGLKKYLEIRQDNPGWWIPTAVQHRKSLKTLYAVSHLKPNDLAQSVLFDKNYPENSIFNKISKLKDMDPQEAAGTILLYNIPTQIAMGAIGRKKEDLEKNPEFILALLEKMSGQQLINNTKLLTSVGVFNSPMLKSEYNKCLERAKKDKKVSTLKAGIAIKAMKDSGVEIDHDVIQKLTELQESKISQKGIEGDWLVLGDCSGSMSSAIKMASDIAGYISKSVKGKVYLIFFNEAPRLFDVTGKTLEEIKDMVKYVRAGGTTSCGCGIDYLMQRNIIVNGITIVSDGGENRGPFFHEAYQKYVSKLQIEPTIYYFRVPGQPDVLTRNCSRFNVQIDQTFDMNGRDEDYYSLPNIIPTMKTSRWSLMDEILGWPLLTFDKVLQIQRKGK